MYSVYSWHIFAARLRTTGLWLNLHPVREVHGRFGASGQVDLSEHFAPALGIGTTACHISGRIVPGSKGFSAGFFSGAAAARPFHQVRLP